MVLSRYFHLLLSTQDTCLHLLTHAMWFINVQMTLVLGLILFICKEVMNLSLSVFQRDIYLDESNKGICSPGYCLPMVKGSKAEIDIAFECFLHFPESILFQS